MPGAHIGDGNYDVYADFRCGDSFDVRIVPLSGSCFESLTELRHSVIQALEAAGDGLYLC